ARENPAIERNSQLSLPRTQFGKRHLAAVRPVDIDDVRQRFGRCAKFPLSAGVDLIFRNRPRAGRRFDDGNRHEMAARAIRIEAASSRFRILAARTLGAVLTLRLTIATLLVGSTWLTVRTLRRTVGTTLWRTVGTL